MSLKPHSTTLRRALLVCAFALAASFAGASVAAELKLGVDLSLTGGTDDYGRAARMGAELALKEYNDNGGYKGQKVDMVLYDDETKPAKGVENVTRLITRDRVFAIVGPVNSGVALAIIDIAQKNQVPLMDTIATAEQITQRYQSQLKNYIFRVSLNDGIQTSFMIDYIVKQHYQRIGLMHDSTGWGQSGRDTALRLLQQANLKVAAGPEVFDQNDTDMTAQLTKMKEAKVDFIISYSLAPAGVQIAKSMQKIGLQVPWTSTWALIAPNFLKLGGKDTVEGVMAVTSYTPDHSDNAKALHAKVDAVFKDSGGDFHPVATAQTYDGVRLLLRALDKVGPEPQKIRDSLEEIDDFTEAVTKMKPHPFSHDNHESLGHDSGFLAVWHNGKLVSVE
ncbi:MAG: ABC transporter substrate-binding protein [Acetobacteraceae bacterium]|nr:ABC transporter substrate-binding protein [Acetobacteraceae bacterium]